MSVSCTMYLGFGYMLPFSAYRKLESETEYDALHKLMDSYHMSSYDDKIVEVNGCSMIVDGMGGSWVFFGKVFKKFSDNASEYPENFEFPWMADQYENLSKIVSEAKRLFGPDITKVNDKFIIPRFHFIVEYS